MLSTTDIRIIQDSINLWGCEGIDSIKFHLLQIFGKDISTNHWIQLGVLIGQNATDKNGVKKQTQNYHERYN